MAPAPTVSVPVPPAGFVPVPAKSLSGYRPMQAELAAVNDAVYELTAFPNWALVFGLTAPSAPSIAARLSVAAGWTSLYAQSNSWTSYTKSQEGMAWKDALEVLDSLKPAFQLAATASPAMANQFPALTRLLGAQKVASAAAVATRKKNAAAAAAKKAADATAAAVAAATAATAAATAAAAASSAVGAANATGAARTVTISG